ncbi:monovalent cation/H+ antiporter subunit D family protein [Georgenia sunbinii]|uniref:monovalent cation/H+ antiporter subunit D family protein n=1 Tax=Georgenia sunbinii TaxID=3117728 RepID=UPI002F261551
MSASLLPLFLAVPLMAAAVMAVVPNRVWRAVVLLATPAAGLVGGALLVWETSDGTVLAHNVGLWPTGIAIPFAVDTLSALMLTATSLLVLVSAWFAIATREDLAPFFPSLVAVLTAGVYGALLTADIFNLFVFIEVMLLPSYGLIAMTGGWRRMKAGRLYVTVNLLTSTVYLAGVGLVYGVAGTVHLGELAAVARENELVAAAGGVMLLALSIKAAVVPVHGWLTRTYPDTSPAVTALFSGLHTKVAIYAIYRIYATMFDGDPTYLWIGVAVFSATMLIGVLGAVGESTSRSILVFHMVSQIGYILLGVALFTQLGLTAGIFYLIHHMIVKASLFLSTGAVEHTYGTSELSKIAGVARRQPLVGFAFIGAALSLAGMPPFSGFVAKLSLLMGMAEAREWVAFAIAIVVSLITLMSMLKIWAGPFWGGNVPSSAGDITGATSASSASSGSSGSSGSSTVIAPIRVRTALIAPALVLTGVTLFLGLAGQSLLALSGQAAAGLLDLTAYLEAVNGL